MTTLAQMPASPPATAAAPPATAALAIAHLSHRYGKRAALDDVSLEIAPGERFALLGPNGSGKSTLFKLVSTLLSPQKGTVSVFGRDVAGQRDAVRKAIGVVFQQPALDKQLTAMENVLCHAALFNIPKKAADKLAAELFARFNIASRAGERVMNLSGGMRRKVELAKALVPRPKLLLLDEPSTGLDVSARIELWRLLDDLKKQSGITVVLSTHLMDEADRCDRIAILNEGKLLDVQTPDTFKTRLGGDVITLRGPDLDTLAAALRERLQLDPQRAGDTLRVEREKAHLYIPHLIEAVPGMIDSLTIGRPTLDDVFVRLTGRQLSGDDDA